MASPPRPHRGQHKGCGVWLEQRWVYGGFEGGIEAEEAAARLRACEHLPTRLRGRQVAVEVEYGVTEELGDDEEMLLIVEVVKHGKERLLPSRVVLPDQGEEPHLAKPLIHAVLVVPENFHRHHHLLVEVEALNHAAERALADRCDDAVALRNDRAHIEIEFRRVLEACGGTGKLKSHPRGRRRGRVGDTSNG